MNSPNLQDEFMKAIMDAMSANQGMSKQALNSDAIQTGLLSMLLGQGKLWENLSGNLASGSHVAAL